MLHIKALTVINIKPQMSSKNTVPKINGRKGVFSFFAIETKSGRRYACVKLRTNRPWLTLTKELSAKLTEGEKTTPPSQALILFRNCNFPQNSYQ